MSVSTISNSGTAYVSDSASAGASKTASNQAQATASASSSAPASSTAVTLSGDAQAYARLAAAGVTVTQQSLASLGVPQQAPNQSASDYAKSIFSALRNTLSEHPQAALTQKDFETLVGNFGGTATQADTLYAQIDTGNTGSVSSQQLLAALGDTQTEPGSAESQTLLSIIDTNHNGVVSGAEFERFESAMVDAERGLPTA